MSKNVNLRHTNHHSYGRDRHDDRAYAVCYTDSDGVGDKGRVSGETADELPRLMRVKVSGLLTQQ